MSDMTHCQYRIVVSKKGHLFTISETDSFTVVKVLRELLAKFPKSDGYTVSLTYYRATGKLLDPIRFVKKEAK